jgi:hypothetical protein
MKRNITLLAGAILLTLFVGCATSYQGMGDTGGYYHQKLSEDIYRIGFRGNGFTPFKRAKDLALLRASEVGSQLGYTYMSVEGSEDLSKTSIVDTGSTSYTTGTAYGYGNTGYYSGTTNTYSNSVAVKKPQVEFVVKYFEGQPKERLLEVYEIAPLMAELKTKHKID